MDEQIVDFVLHYLADPEIIGVGFKELVIILNEAVEANFCSGYSELVEDTIEEWKSA